MEYGLIGEKLGHSYSKMIHEKLADYNYEITPVAKENFAAFMKAGDFKAINVTIPYKSDVIPYLDTMDDNARRIGAVNTIVKRNGKLTGYNTDFYGFLYMVNHNNVKIAGKKVIVLGNGGAAKAILAVLEYLEAGDIIIVKRTAGDGIITYEECEKQHSDAQVIINTSPVGMYPNVDASPIDVSLYPNCEAVLDIIYNPLKTELLLQAEGLGIKAVNGLEMLVAQAKKAVEYFLDKKIDDAVVDEIHEKILKEI